MTSFIFRLRITLPAVRIKEKFNTRYENSLRMPSKQILLNRFDAHTMTSLHLLATQPMKFLNFPLFDLHCNALVRPWCLKYLIAMMTSCLKVIGQKPGKVKNSFPVKTTTGKLSFLLPRLIYENLRNVKRYTLTVHLNRAPNLTRSLSQSTACTTAEFFRL